MTITVELQKWHRILGLPIFEQAIAHIETLEAAQEHAAREAARAQQFVFDPVVEANRQLLLDRSQVGIKKYGVTLGAAGLSRTQHLRHALEEALDLANYLQAELMRASAKPPEMAQACPLVGEGQGGFPHE